MTTDRARSTAILLGCAWLPAALWVIASAGPWRAAPELLAICVGPGLLLFGYVAWMPSRAALVIRAVSAFVGLLTFALAARSARDCRDGSCSVGLFSGTVVDVVTFSALAYWAAARRKRPPGTARTPTGRHSRGRHSR